MIKSRFRHCLLLYLVASCATESIEPDTAVDPGADAFGQHPADPARTAALLATAQSFVRPGSVMQTEPRLGVPTVLWAREPVSSTASTRWLTAGTPHPELAASRAALADYAPLYKLDANDVASAVVASVHDLGTGPVLVKYRAQIGGIEIFREELNVVMNRKLEAVALTGYLTSASTPAARPGGLDFQLPAPAGAIAAVNQLAKAQLDAARLVPIGSRDGYDFFDLAADTGVVLADPVRMKKVYFHTGDGLEAAYYVEVSAYTGPPVPDTLTLDGGLVPTLEASAYVVSAATGQPLFRKNLIADAVASAPQEAAALPAGGFTYRVWADPLTGVPYDTPAGNGAHPKLAPVPDGAQAAFAAPQNVSLRNFPFSRNDPWIAPGATETIGNNVDAFLNLFSPDGFGPAAAPADPATGDYRAQITAPGQFLHTQILDGNPFLAEGRQGAIQQLFYNINFLHDWYYDAGFDEAAGNAQTDNFGRGGLGNDSIRGQAQDFSGFSNANMQTPADGGRPRMRMYVFPSVANTLDIQAPAALASKRNIGVSMSGPQTFDVTGDIVIATFTAAPACTVTNPAAIAGKIAFFDFDNTDGTGCAFSTRITRLTATSAAAIVMQFTLNPANNPTQNPNAAVNITGFVPANVKAMGTVSVNTGLAIKAQLAAGQTVTARLLRKPDRDGSLDNQIVFHEFFHYVSNRLVGNGAGLGTTTAGGMGEGWSDFAAMLLTVREDDTAVASNSQWNGAYALATWATSGVRFDGAANNGYYFGIRRYPYSTDMAKNPLTFKHTANGVALPVGPPVGFGADGASNAEVHNTGEVWTTMLWECYAGLLRDTLSDTPRLTFQQAQDRMKRYVIGGLKVTPLFPTIAEARDAILSVALANDLADYVVFLRAFAKRGAGTHAVAPDRFTTDNVGVVEDFAVGPDIAIAGVTLDDAADSCDADGVLDRGEIGQLTVTVRNTGTTALRATTAVISTPSLDVWFPDGNTVAFRSMTLGATATATLRVAYARNVTGVTPLDVRIDVSDPALPGPATRIFGFRTNTDDAPASSSTDTAESATTPNTTSFGASFFNAAPWRRLEVSAAQHAWHADDAGTGTDQYLLSPAFTVGPSGSVNLAFDHAWSFESDPSGNFDGGVVEMSTNGGAFVDIGGPAYTGTLLVYAGNVNPLQGRPAFVASSGGVVHTSLTRSVAAGSTVRFRFRAASDGAAGGPGWTIDNIAYTGVVETPFTTVIEDREVCTKVPLSADLGLTLDDGVTSLIAGGRTTYTITATNSHGSPVSSALVLDRFPTDLSCTWRCQASGGGVCTASGTGNIQDVVNLPVGGSVRYLATCTLSRTITSSSLTNIATITLPTTQFDPVSPNNKAIDIDAVSR